MGAITSSQLVAWSGGKWFREVVPAATGQFHMDTRDLRGGDVFVALKTGKRDGHDFLRQAMNAGAAAAIVERPDMSVPLAQLLVDDTLDALHKIASGARKQFTGTLIGITGSCGKTSTKELLAHLMGEGVMATEGNLNNYIGMPLTLTRLDPAAYKSAVVEVGISQKGEMAPLAEILNPDRVIVTCVAPAHLEGLGSIEGVAAQKAQLPAKVGRDGCVFFPSDCLRYTPFCELRARSFVTAAMNLDTPAMPASNFNLVRYQTFHSTASEHMEMLIFMPGTERFARFQLPHLSAGMQSNAALALAAALEMGIPEDVLRMRVLEWKPARMRGEVRRAGNVDFYVDCYNANPASMLDAVDNFRCKFPTARRLFLLGCMNELGERSTSLHEELGANIGRSANETFCIVGPEGESVRTGLIKAGVDAENVVAAKDRDVALAILKEFEKGAGAVFVKGSRAYKMEEFLPATISRKDSH
jgi:UDP-N-acetylmuramoyl-tripeptide--D-alanyl-D-alanine ligase